MAKKSGISVEFITKFGGISTQFVRNLGGKITADLGFGPDYNAASCETLILGHSPTVEPGMVCMFPRANYQFDSTNRILYAIGEPCGGTPAPNGFYSDGRTIFGWFDQIWEVVGSCRR
jgi:hypothetical protein